jgi:ferredoxin
VNEIPGRRPKEHIVRVIVDRDACIGSGNCVLTVPDVFDQDEEGTVVLLTDDPIGLEDEVSLAALQCPAQAITVEES